MNSADPPSASRQVDHVTLFLFGRSLRLSRFTYLLILGLIIGAVTGAIAVLFRLAAIYGEHLFLPHEDLIRDEPWLLVRRLLVPAAGGLVVGLALYRLGRYTASHSIPIILRAVASGQSHLPARLAVPPALSVITIASGNSVGVEGPIAELGAVLGSLVGRVLNAPPRLVKTLMGAGVAAGIAAVFNAPISGVFFAIEVILRNYEIAGLTPIVVAAVVGSVISQLALGNHAALAHPAITELPLRELPLFAVLGLACGILAILYILALSWTRTQFRGLRLPLWLKPALGGLAVGIIGLGLPQVMGEGYTWVRQFMLQPGLPLLLAVLILFKILATSLTLGSGSPGGTFAPAVFQGVVLGSLFGQGMAALGWAQSALPYGVIGIGGMIATALGAPLTGIMIVLRSGGSDTTPLLLPVMTTVAFGMFVMQSWRRGSVYTHELLREGYDPDRVRQVDPLELIRVESVVERGPQVWIEAALPLNAALERCKTALERWFLVRGEQDAFRGIVSLHDLRVAIADPQLGALLVVGDIVEPVRHRLTPEMNLVQAMALFRLSENDLLPVFASAEASAQLLGVVSRQKMLEVYLEAHHGPQNS